LTIAAVMSEKSCTRRRLPSAMAHQFCSRRPGRIATTQELPMPFNDSGVAQRAVPGTCTPAQRPAHRPRHNLLRTLLWITAAAASCAFLVSATVTLVDRPAATWIHQHLTDDRFAFFTASYDTHPLRIGPFSLMASPAEALGPLAVVVLLIQGVLAVAGHRPHMRGRIILTAGLAILVALQINATLKGVFGRTWPESWLGSNPSWINDGVFGFFPFHGGKGWGSFPSGHTTVITTLATVLWIAWPTLRVLWTGLVCLVIAGLIGANYHYVADTIGGVYLGIAIGIGMAGLLLQPKDRLDWSTFRNPPDRS
jgi:membrane-associated phospholipid phosphatase